MRKKVVFVGLSGGVDSAVSAALLKKQGYEVVGVFIKTWHPDFLECNEEEERRDAMRVAAHLDIPFLTFDFEKVYKKEVADYMIREYKAGRTPNPDVLCNKEVKFGAFLNKAISMGADFVATGHYAQVVGCWTPEIRVSNTRQDARQEATEQKHFPLSLLKGKDPSKDQSYFLWTLRQEQLSKILFPVGNFKKTEVRKWALKFGLPVAEKKDSQGICFLGAVDLKDFLKHYIKSKKGKVLNENGKVIGHHNGVFFYTLGERHGFTITKKGPNDSRYYVVGKDVKKNILIVSQYPLRHSDTSPYSRGRKGGGISVESTNWISENYPLEAKSYTCQIRYHGEFLPCQVKCSTPSVAQVIFQKPVLVASGLPAKTLVAAGQSCVIYDRDICLGGGVVV